MPVLQEAAARGRLQVAENHFRGCRMLLIVGVLVVIGAVVGGYLMEGGAILLLSQPAEFVIIGGAAIGSLLISTSPKILTKLARQCGSLFAAGLTRDDFADLLAMLFQLF